MKPEHLEQLIEGKRQWTEPLTPEEQAKGFKGWYSSKYLPHFDSPGAQQYLTYRLADSLPAERRGEWEAFMALEDERRRSPPARRPLPREQSCQSASGALARGMALEQCALSQQRGFVRENSHASGG
jgi:hypothetical protein